MKMMSIAVLSFLVGLGSFKLYNLHLNDEGGREHVAVDTAPILANAGCVSRDDDLLNSLDAIHLMLEEQSLRLEATEDNLSYLLDPGESVAVDDAEKNTNTEEVSVVPNERFLELGSYVDAQLEKGFWSVANVKEVMSMSASLSNEERTAIGQKIVMAINSGQIELEDVTMPIF